MSSSATSGGYSKPSAGGVTLPAVSSATPASGDAKPVAPASSATSGGYSKPSAGGVTLPAVSSATPASGDAKPVAPASLATSGGYGKPQSAVTAGPAPTGSAADLAISRRQSASALDEMRQKNKDPVAPPVTATVPSGGGRPVATTSDSRSTSTSISTGAITQTGVYHGVPVQSAASLREMAAQQLAQRRQLIASSRQTPLYQELAGGQSYTRDAIVAIRGGQENRYPSRYHGSPLFDGHRQYGSLDPSFLMGQLYAQPTSGVGRDNSRFWYGLLGVAGVAAFLADATDLAAATGDHELLGRIQTVNKEAEVLRQAGEPRPNGSQVLKATGIPPEVMFRPEVLTNQEEKSPLRFAAGQAKGVYYAFCNGGKGLTGLRERAFLLKTHCLQTQGSQENLDALVKGQADAILVQADVADLWLREDASRKLGPYQVTLMQEPFWLLVNEASGIDGLDDLKPDRHTLSVGLPRSGTAISWHNLLHHNQTGAVREGVDSKLAHMPIRNVDPMASAKLVAEDPKQVMLMVMGMDSPLMEEIAATYGKQLKLVPFEAKAFKNVADRENNPVYRSCTVPGGRYPTLQEGWFFTSVDTLCVDTVVVLSEEWAKRNGEAEENSFLDAATQTIDGFQAKQLMKKK